MEVDGPDFDLGILVELMGCLRRAGLLEEIAERRKVCLAQVAASFVFIVEVDAEEENWKYD